ncbi:hypothetical protein CAP35_12630 [Chitinophagaceae bacterium IBVUCB1]|nr:hypothetical protein CAP35_12630 [Chitinophagaceae bacterium IBVUCB1]
MNKLLLLACCIVLPFFVHAKYQFLLRKKYAQRYKAIDSCFYYNAKLRADKQAFLKEIKVLEEEAKSAGDIELVSEAKLLNIALNSASEQGDFLKAEKDASDLLAYALQNKLTQIEIRCRQFAGRYYMEKAGRYIEGINEFLMSYYLMQQISIQDFPTKKEHMYEVAHAYYNFGDFESAKKYMMEAQRTPMPNNTKMQDDKNKIRTYINLENTLGLLYRNEQKYDSAIHCFRTVYNLAVAQKDTAWIGGSTGNIGITYYLQKQYSKAVPLLAYDIECSIKYGEWNNATNSLIKLTDIYLQQHNMPVVKVLIDSSLRLLANKSITEPAQHLQYLYPIMAKYYNEVGNARLAYNYMDSARVAKELMDKKKNAMALAHEEHRLQLQVHHAEMQKHEDDKQFQLLRKNTIIAVIALFAGIVIVFINGRRKYYMQKNKLEEAKRQMAEDELNNAHAQLDDFRKRIYDKNELIERIRAEVENTQQAAINPTYVNNEVLTQLMQSILLTDEQWEQFRVNFEKVHTGFLLRLREKLPDLTPSETRYLALAKLKLSNKEMAAMLGVSMQGVRNYRYRLRKKFNLPEEGDIDDLINEI